MSELKLKIGDKVKINIDELERNSLDECNEDYYGYISNNGNKVYKIVNIIDAICPYMIDDEFLSKTSFDYDELIKV